MIYTCDMFKSRPSTFKFLFILPMSCTSSPAIGHTPHRQRTPPFLPVFVSPHPQHMYNAGESEAQHQTNSIRQVIRHEQAAKMNAGTSSSRKRKRTASSSTPTHRLRSLGSIDETSDITVTPPNQFAEFYKLMQGRGTKKEKNEWPPLMNLVSNSSHAIEFLY
jgi:hypothetical protein